MNGFSKQRVYISLLILMVIVAGCTHENVLSKIETYKAPPYPRSEYLDRETYDYRTKNQVPVPPTLTDVFICDLWVIMTMDLELKGISPYRVSENNLIQALSIYLSWDWNKIRGYRPWTHSNFVRSLTEKQRKILAKEIVEYMAKNGVKDVE